MQISYLVIVQRWKPLFTGRQQPLKYGTLSTKRRSFIKRQSVYVRPRQLAGDATNGLAHDADQKIIEVSRIVTMGAKRTHAGRQRARSMDGQRPL